MSAAVPDLEGLLRTRHAGDVFVDECKMGMTGSRRLDAWVLRKTWSPFTTIGYEIKRTRQDFLRDEKWPAYLGVCHELYWVCPPRLIALEEVPEGCGLLWSAGSRLLTKRKAPRHAVNPEALIPLMSYVLMSRCRIVGDMWQANAQATADAWRGLLLEQQGEKILGHVASRRVRAEVADLRRRTLDAVRRSQSFEHLERRLREAGVDPDEPEAFAKAHELLAGTDASLQLAEARRSMIYHGRALLAAAHGER